MGPTPLEITLGRFARVPVAGYSSLSRNARYEVRLTGTFASLGYVTPSTVTGPKDVS